MPPQINHTLDIFIHPDTQVLILGSFPSVKSREANFFYSYPRNRFYKTLSNIFNEEELYAYFKKQVEKHNKSSINEWILEKQTLKKKPIHDFLLVDVGKANVNSYSCICIRGNSYSVKEEFIEKTVSYKVINDSDVVIDYQGEVIGRHKLKVDGTGNYVIDITHFLKTFLKKPNALPHSVALRQAEKNLRAIYENNYKGKPREFVVFLLGGKVEWEFLK